MPEPLGQETIRYKTYVKTALTEGMRGVFTQHVDDLLQRTRVTIDYPTTENDYPTVIVRFFERSIRNAGVGHVEWLESEDGDLFRHKHYLYDGDIEFAIYALSSLDRDLISDSVVQTLSMGTLEAYTNAFFVRIYEQDVAVNPTADIHYINVNTDEIRGFGETQNPVPWGEEDLLVYQTSYRVGITGEFYNLPPEDVDEVISRVDSFPYQEGDPVPTGKPDDDAQWLSTSEGP